MNNDIFSKIKAELNNYIVKHINNVRKTFHFHNGLQRRIAFMAEIFGYKSVMEYKMGNKDVFNKNKYMDVVWMDKNKNIVYAIEIDSSLKTGSIKKLNYINAENKIWILYCNSINNYNFDNLMNKYNKDKKITIIYLGALRQYIRTRNSVREINTNRAAHGVCH
jgi:hypothetical protein